MISSYGFAGFPPCFAHDGLIHSPAHCLTEGVLHGVVHKVQEKAERIVILTTHLGSLDRDARERRRVKNLRNRARKAEGNAFHARGSQRKARHRA
jgi:hypothetical protein